MYIKIKAMAIWNLKILITDIHRDSKEGRADVQRIKCCQGAMVNRALGLEAQLIIKLAKKMKTLMISMKQS